MKKYIVYYRVSTKKQGQSGLGLSSQKSIMEHFLPAEMLAGEYIEVMSGGKAQTERPQLAAALKECIEKGYGLAVAKVDRLSRVTEDALQVFKDLDGFLFAADIPMTPGNKMDKFTLTIYMAIADRERELIKIRTRAAMSEVKKREKAGEKRYHKDGSLKQKIGKPEHLTESARENGLSVRKEKALIDTNWVKAGDYAQMLRAKGYTLEAIAEKLNSKGFVTRRKKEFFPITVSRLLEKAI